MPERGAMGAELWLHRDLYVDPEHDPLVVLVDERVGEARWLSAMTARYDRRLAETYLRGAGELACRANGGDAERRAWGARSMLAELACGLRLPETTLARRLARTTMLAAFPQLMDAAESGRVSSWHCDVMLDVFSGVPDPGVLARADQALIGKALTSTAPQLREAARRWRARNVARSDEQRSAALADRRVELTLADDDMMWLSALIPAPAAVAIDRRLDAIAAAAGGPDDARSAIQLRADAFVDLLLDASTARPSEPVAGSAREAGMTSPAFPAGTPVAAGSARDRTGDSGPLAAPTGATPVDTGPNGRPAASRDADAHQETPSTGAAPRGTTDGHSDAEPVPGWVRAIRAEVILTVPVLSLLGRSDEPAELEGFGPIDIETAKLLAANAPSFVRVLTHPETGAVLSVGRDRYRIPADLRRTVQLRDVTCRFPGCNRRAGRCDVDHALAWADGGATEACNLACLCRKHHRLKHEMDWQVGQEAGGVLVWRSALGRTYRTQPGTRWPPPPTDRERGTAPRAGMSPGRGDRRARTRPRVLASVGSSSAPPDEPPF